MIDKLNVFVKKLHPDAIIPFHATEQSAGVDLSALVAEDVIIHPQKWALIPTGLSIALPIGYEAQIRSRSGLAYKNGVMVLNSPGTIDADYRGEIKILLANFSEQPFVVASGMRIAQMVISRYNPIHWIETEDLDSTKRCSFGFGSTGV